MAQKQKKIDFSKNYVDTIQLEKYKGKKSRYICPHCGQQEFTRYINVTTGEHLCDENGDYIYGKCNRSIKCGYHKSPKNTGLPLKTESSKVLKDYIESDISHFIEPCIVLDSINSHSDYFSDFLFNNFNYINVIQALRRYKVGTAKMWGSQKATLFWQIDIDNNIRTGKIMLYDGTTGKRVKKPFNHISWVHSSFQESFDSQDFCLTQCLFGEHLLRDMPTSVKDIYVVESEKTAILCTIANPNKYFVATGGLQNINYERLLPFSDKRMVFYPDKGEAFNIWAEKLKAFEGDFDIIVSDVVEKLKELSEGEDLGDYIILKNNKC